MAELALTGLNEVEYIGELEQTIKRKRYLAEMLDAWPKDAELGVQQSGPSNPILFMADERPSESHLIMPSVLKS